MMFINTKDADDVTNLGSKYLKYISKIKRTAMIILDNIKFNEIMLQNIQSLNK